MNISVVVATYNGEKYLTELLYSIITQSTVPDEIIIIDDFSTDHTEEIIENFINSYNGNVKIKFSKNPKNMGVVKTFQKGINLSSGEVIFLADQDDIWLEDKIKSILRIFNKNSEINVVAHGFTLINYKGENISHRVYPFRNQKKIIFQDIIKSNKFPGCTMAFRSSLKKYMYYIPPEIYIHDWYIAIIGAMCSGLYYYNKPLIKYRLHKENIIGMNLTYSFKSTKKARILAYIRREEFIKAITKMVKQDLFDIYPHNKEMELKNLSRIDEFYKNRINVLKRKNLLKSLSFLFFHFYMYDTIRGIIGDIVSIVRD